MDFTIVLTTGIVIILYSTYHTTYARKQQGLRWWTLAYTLEQPKSSHETNDIAQLSDSTIINQLTPALQPLTKKQRKLVTNNPGSILAVGKGALMAIGECKYQFKNRRWNCPTNQTTNDVSIFGNILNIGCRETAFIYAITSAGVAHSISRACTEGKIYTCTCDYRTESEPSGENWKWGGCSDNVNFGYQFSKQFVDSIERGEDLRYTVNKQNNEAGRRHVQSVMTQQCKCHGMSGSCTMKTCWMRLPPFREIGNLLKERFDGASMVYAGNSLGGNRPPSGSDSNRASRSSNRIISNSVTNNKSRNRDKKKTITQTSKGGSNKYNFLPVDSSHKIPTRKDMVYFEESPEFCGNDPGLEFKGTSNRECNATSLGIDGCELMCCNNGYRTEHYVAREHCRCVFKWCCEVECDVCEFERYRHICN